MSGATKPVRCRPDTPFWCRRSSAKAKNPHRHANGRISDAGQKASANAFQNARMLRCVSAFVVATHTKYASLLMLRALPLKHFESCITMTHLPKDDWMLSGAQAQVSFCAPDLPNIFASFIQQGFLKSKTPAHPRARRKSILNPLPSETGFADPPRFA